MPRPPPRSPQAKPTRTAKAKRGRHARGQRRHRQAYRYGRRHAERGIWVYRAHDRHFRGYVYARRELGGYFARGRCECRRTYRWRD